MSCEKLSKILSTHFSIVLMPFLRHSSVTAQLIINIYGNFFSHLATSSRIKLCYQRAGRVRTKWRRKLDIHSSWSRNWFFSICKIACVHTIFPITYVLSLPRLLFCEISCNLKQFFACAFHVLFVCCIIAYTTKSLNHLKVFLVTSKGWTVTNPTN